jgi:4-amino-4-deoxy-L-arabinose transferase-like glycosyltransferase
MVPEVHVRFDVDPEGVLVDSPVDPALQQYAAECGFDNPPLRPYESSQAPLYYLVVGLIASPMSYNPHVLLYMARLVAVSFGAGTIFFCWRATRSLAPGEPLLASATAAVILLMPQFDFNAATAGNDSALNCACAAALAFWIRGLRQPEYDPWMLRGGAAAGLAILAKISALALLPALALVVIFRAGQAPEGRERWRRPLRMGLGAATMVALTAGWWFVRNAMIYGDPTGMRDITRYYQAQVGNDARVRLLRIDSVGDWIHLLQQTGISLIGNFGWMNRPLPLIYYLVSLSLAGCLILTTLITVRGLRLSPPAWQAIAVMVAVTTGLVVLFLRLNFNVQLQAQGRYLYPAVLPLGLALTGGLATPISRRGVKSLLLGVVFLWMVALNVAGLLSLG